MVTRPLATGVLPTDEGTRELELAWGRARSLITPNAKNAAFVWPRGGSHQALSLGEFPAVPVGVLESWLHRNITPAVRNFSQDIDAAQVVTVLGWHDQGVTVPSHLLDDWKRLVSDEWHRARTAWVLVSGCGYPDPEGRALSLVHPHRHTHDWRPWKKAARQAPRWSKRNPCIVFRGATSGGLFDLDEHSVLDELLRGRLLLALHTSPLPSDAAFSLLVHTREGHEDTVEAVLRSRTLLSSPLSVSEMMRFRYQLMVDGHHGAWEAHVWKLLSGSTCLWVESTAVNWYDRFFEPWVHYVPVRADGSDLLERYGEVLDDEKRARRMASACRRRARRVFRRRFMFRTVRDQWRETWNHLLTEG